VIIQHISFEAGGAEGGLFYIDHDGGDLQQRGELVENFRPPETFINFQAPLNDLCRLELREQLGHGGTADIQSAGQIDFRENRHLPHLPDGGLQVDLPDVFRAGGLSWLYLFLH